MRMGGVARIERGAGRAGDLDPLAGGEILDYAVEILQRRLRHRAEVEQLGTAAVECDRRMDSAGADRRVEFEHWAGGAIDLEGDDAAGRRIDRAVDVACRRSP